VSDLDPRSRERALRFAMRPAARVPSGCPWLVRPWSARAFNEAWYRAAPRRERGRIIPLSSSFFPDIGLATASPLAKGGTRSIVLAARKPERLEQAATGLRARGADVRLVGFDADTFETHKRIVDDISAAVGDVDLALLAFGVLGSQQVAERDPAAALEIAGTNYLGAISLLIPLAQRLASQGHGDIVLLSSVAAERPRRSNFVYGSSKAGIDAFEQGLGDRTFGTGVRVIVIRPGFVFSKMTDGLDVPPFSTTPAAVARAIVDAVRGAQEVIWVPWQIRCVMSLLRHLPRSVFRRMEL
jgi:decaprenylphospho-beta-D-erythro-pentofuranosid-2-ulose 2-reductase